MAGRHGEPEHVTEGPGIPRGDRPGGGEDRRGQHRLRRDDATQRRQPALVLGGASTLEDEPVEVLTRESHPHPHARLRVVRHRGRHGVLEGTVEMRQPGVDLDEGDRVGPGEGSGRDGGPGPWGRSPEQGELLGLVRRRGRRFGPGAGPPSSCRSAMPRT